MSAKGELCTRCKHACPELDEALCFKCKNHENKRKIKPGLKRMPESCMYGWMGDFCRKLNCPLDAAYPTVLAIGAGYGVPFTTTVRTNLYTTLIGSKGTGKSVTIKRILTAWSPPAEIQVIKKYPGSEIGLIQLLGGKKHKDMDQQDFVAKPYLLVQDEMRATLGKVNIQNSALPYMFNQLFYQNDYGTASKQGHYECAAKLSMVGGLTCEDADEFASVYGVETTTGMYDRQIFGVCPEEWDFNHEGWVPPTEADVRFAEPEFNREFENIEFVIDKSFIQRDEHLQFWKEWLRADLMKSSRESIMTIKQWPSDHPYKKKYMMHKGLYDYRDLFHNHTAFQDSKAVIGLQVADICANVCYRFYRDDRKDIRAYEKLFRRIMCKGGAEIHVITVDERSLHKGDLSELVGVLDMDEYKRLADEKEEIEQAANAGKTGLSPAL